MPELTEMDKCRAHIANARTARHYARKFPEAKEALCTIAEQQMLCARFHYQEDPETMRGRCADCGECFDVLYTVEHHENGWQRVCATCATMYTDDQEAH